MNGNKNRERVGQRYYVPVEWYFNSNVGTFTRPLVRLPQAGHDDDHTDVSNEPVVRLGTSNSSDDDNNNDNDSGDERSDDGTNTK